MEFNLAIKPELIGKDFQRQGGTWPTRHFTPTSLAKWAFTEHRAFCHSVFDNERYNKVYNGNLKYSARRNEFFVSSEVFVVDIDTDQLTEQVDLTRLLTIPVVQQHAFLIMPSSGWRPDRLNWHILFKLSEAVTDIDEYRALAKTFYLNFPFAVDHALAKVAQPTYGTLFKSPEQHAIGYSLDRVYINEAASEVSVADLRRQEYTIRQRKDADDKKRRKAELADLLERGEERKAGSVLQRISAHNSQPIEQRERVVLECLGVILEHFDETTPNELWYQVWTAAHDGAPTTAVRDFIIDHPKVVWKDGRAGKEAFANRWLSHENRDDGYTVASLFYVARHYGWLTNTPYDIPSKRAETINVQLIEGWTKGLDVVPDRVLVKSQTGSGKTQNLIYLFDRLGQPKTVVFVPTIKLAIELYGTLKKAGLPAELYIEEDNQKPRDAEDLRNAKMLVTTLQTFATRVFRVGEASIWGLVYIEEADQIFSSFARAGHGFGSTHVREYEARRGFEALQEIFRYSGYVWGVDATATLVAYDLFHTLTGGEFLYVENEYIRTKAPVKVVSSYGEALQVALRSLMKNLRVVVAVDTASGVETVYQTLELTGVLKGKKTLYLNRNIAQADEVRSFMMDVNAGAQKLDLLVYNSVIGSGVSITSIQPDVVVQIASYLTPKANLQLLNRFRQQAVVYVHVGLPESLYGLSATELDMLLVRRFRVEAQIVGVPMVERDDLTRLREHLANLSNANDGWQMRAPLTYYMELLRGDGRVVEFSDPVPPIMALGPLLEAVKAIREEAKEYIRNHWREAPIVNENNPPDPEMSVLEIAMGEHHGLINDVLWSNIPDGVDPAYISDVVDMFKSKAFALTTFMRQAIAVQKAEAYLADQGQALTAITNSVTQAKVVSLIHALYHDLDEVLYEDTLTERAPLFVKAIENQQEMFDLVVGSRHKYAVLSEKYEGEKLAVMVAKILLAKVGLQQRYDKNRNAYSIVNLNEAADFLKWRLTGSDEFVLRDLRTDEIDNETERRSRAADIMQAMDEDSRALVMLRWMQNPSSGFEDAVFKFTNRGNLFA